MLFIPTDGADDAAAAFHGNVIIFGERCLIVSLNLFHFYGIALAQCCQMRRNCFLINVGNKIFRFFRDVGSFGNKGCVTRQPGTVRLFFSAAQCCLVIACVDACIA